MAWRSEPYYRPVPVTHSMKASRWDDRWAEEAETLTWTYTWHLTAETQTSQRHNKSSLELDPFSVNVLLSIMILYENVSEGNVLSEMKVLLSFSRSGDFLSADAVFHELDVDDGCWAPEMTKTLRKCDRLTCALYISKSSEVINISSYDKMNFWSCYTQ